MKNWFLVIIQTLSINRMIFQTSLICAKFNFPYFWIIKQFLEINFGLQKYEVVDFWKIPMHMNNIIYKKENSPTPSVFDEQVNCSWFHDWSLRKELLRGPAKLDSTTLHLNLKVNFDLFRFDVILILYWLLICNVKVDT